MAATSSVSKSRLPALDGVRALAIGGVMLLHAYSARFPGGAAGVDVFFVLSAFLITTLVVQEVTSRGGDYSFRDFYVRRVARLLPALLMFCLIVGPLTSVAVHQQGKILPGTLVSLSWTGDVFASRGADFGIAYTHVWSLAVEEQFYLVWPLVLVCLLRRGFFRLGTAVGLLVLSVIVFLLASSAYPKATYFLPTGHAVALASGVLAAYVAAHTTSRTKYLSMLSTTLTGGFLLLYALDVLGELGSSRVVGNACVVGLALLSAATIALLNQDQELLPIRLLSLTPLVWLGQRSYGLYLYHRALAIAVPGFWHGVRLTTGGPLVILISLGLAEASYRYIERPVGRWMRERWSTGHSPAAQVVALSPAPFSERM